MPQCSVEHDFVFVFGSKGVKHTLTVPILMPIKQSVDDLTGRIIFAHNIPCYAEKGK